MEKCVQEKKEGFGLRGFTRFYRFNLLPNHTRFNLAPTKPGLNYYKAFLSRQFIAWFNPRKPYPRFTPVYCIYPGLPSAV
jgi:hypothetical protein